MSKINVLTGLRPTGNLHLGHYFGALTNWVKMQDDYNCRFEIADVQALTDNYDNPVKVRTNVKETVIDLLSVGIDPDKSIIFIQSMIPEIAELTVYFSNLVTIARLYRNPTVKTEAKQKKELFGESSESITYGFLGYPVSQAADIAIFNGEAVPVGEDQKPLLEQAREIVRKFNSIYGDTFVEPKQILSKNPRIKGLDGNEKMGKSLGNAIFLCDSDEIVSNKIMNAITDPGKIKKDDPANPEICMVYYYHNLVNKENVENVCFECKKGLRGCVNCKKELINSMIEFLKPIKEKRNYYEQHPEIVDKILIDGTNKAKLEAENNMLKIKEALKIDYFDAKEIK